MRKIKLLFLFQLGRHWKRVSCHGKTIFYSRDRGSWKTISLSSFNIWVIVSERWMSHQSDWIYYEQPIKFLALLQIHVTWHFYLIVSNSNLTLVFHGQNKPVGKQKQETNIAARPEKCLDLSFALMVIVKNGNFWRQFP